MAPIQDFTPCVQENRQDYPDPNSDFKWSEVESTAAANREAILACHEDDWLTTTTGETYDLNAEFLRAVQFFQQASQAAPSTEHGVWYFSQHSPQRQAELFHDTYDILYGLEPYEAPPRLSKWGPEEILGGMAGLAIGGVILAFIEFGISKPSNRERLLFLAGSVATGVAVAKGIREWTYYDSHNSHWYTHDELMAIETGAVEVSKEAQPSEATEQSDKCPHNADPELWDGLKKGLIEYQKLGVDYQVYRFDPNDTGDLNKNEIEDWLIVSSIRGNDNFQFFATVVLDMPTEKFHQTSLNDLEQMFFMEYPNLPSRTLGWDMSHMGSGEPVDELLALQFGPKILSPVRMTDTDENNETKLTIPIYHFLGATLYITPQQEHEVSCVNSSTYAMSPTDDHSENKATPEYFADQPHDRVLKEYTEHPDLD